MTSALQTIRLVLRSFAPGDAPRLAELLNDLELVQWLTLVPYPYGLEDAKAFIERVREHEPYTYAIEHNGVLVGAVGVGAQLGYWIAKTHHGMGLATEAAEAAIEGYFQRGNALLKSSYHEANLGSRRVQEKLGFRDVGRGSSVVRSTGKEVPTILSELTRADWGARV